MNDLMKMKQEIRQEVMESVIQKFQEIKFESYDLIDDFFDGYKLFHSDEKDNDYYLLLNIFDFIFSLGEKGKIYLWNELWESLVNSDYELPKIYRNDFTKDQLSFIDEIIFTNERNEIRYGDNYLLYPNLNINEDIVLDRIRLSKVNSELDIEYFMNNHDAYEKYYYKEYDEYYLNRFCSQIDRNLSFAILDEFTGEFYGIIALSLLRNDAVYNIEYFIFPEFRGKGFAKEAMNGLLNKVIQKEIYILSPTIKEGIVEKVVANIKCIEARIQTDNLPSQKLVESFGFKQNGLIPFAGKLKDNYYDEKMYHFIIE